MEFVGHFTKKLTYSDTSSTTIGCLPPKSLITAVNVVVTTAFNAGGNDYLDVGVTGAAAQVVNDHSLASKGAAFATIAATANDSYSTSAGTVIKGVYVPSGSSPTTGECYVTVYYTQL